MATLPTWRGSLLQGPCLEDMARAALEGRRWGVMQALFSELPPGHRLYWDAILAARDAGIGASVPLQAWAVALLSGIPAEVTGDEVAQLTDALMATPVVAEEGVAFGRRVDHGVLRCVAAAQAGWIDAKTCCELARLFVNTQQLRAGAMDLATRREEGPRRALLLLDAMARAGKLAAQQKAAVYDLADSVAGTSYGANEFVEDVQALSTGAVGLQGFCLRVAQRQRASATAHAALAQHMLMQWAGSDTPGALDTARRIERGHEPARAEPQHAAMVQACRKAPRAFAGVLYAAIATRDYHALVRLLPLAHAVLPGGQVALFNALWDTRSSGTRLWTMLSVGTLRAFFADSGLTLRELSVTRLQQLLPTLDVWYAPERLEEDVLFFLSQVMYGGDPMPHALLRAWQTAARTPQLTYAMTRLASGVGHSLFKRTLVPALVEGTLSDRGFLLAVHAAAAAPGLWGKQGRHLGALAPSRPPVCKNEARIELLLHSQPLLKNQQALRALLSGLAQVGQLQLRDVSRLLMWPDDAQLHPWLHDGCKRARASQASALRALCAGRADRATARATRDAAALWADGLRLHAEYVGAKGDAAGAQASLAGELEAQRAHLLQLAAWLPADSAGHALARAFAAAPVGSAQDAAAKALNLWRKTRAHAPEAELAAQVHAAASLCTQSDRTLRHLSKAAPGVDAVAPSDFFAAHPTNKTVQALYNHHVVPLLTEALHTLVTLDAFGECEEVDDTPQAVLEAKSRVLPARRGAVDALLARFRDPQLFWAFASRMRAYDSVHARGFDTTLEHLLTGTHTEQRRGSMQMQALFGNGERDALRDAWEAGAWGQVHAEPFAGLRLHDTGTFEDFASSGDEVGGSCHSLMLGGHYQYLMGRVVCGSKRMVTIKDARGRMVARAMLRMMLDEHDQPALMLSRTYVLGGHRNEATVALQAFATERAQALGLPLVGGGAALGDDAVRVHCKTGEFAEYWDERHSGNSFVVPMVWRPAA